MLGILIEKELKHTLLGPKFVATFLVCSVLILLSLFIGVKDYKASMQRYEAAVALADQELAERTSWNQFSTRFFRKPDPMRVFAVGVANDLGRLTQVNAQNPIRLDHSVYADDPIFAVFRFLDLGFIFQVVLSLFAILFTYNAINGEREMGTLKLALSNGVPRTQYVLAKFAGSWLALVVPLLAPLLAGLLMVLVMGVPLTAVHWARVVALLGVSLLYLTFFIALGILVSSWTRHSSASFLILLVFWVAAVLVVPRAGMMLAAKIIPAPSVAEIDAYSKSRWDQYMRDLQAILESRRAMLDGMNETERQAYRDDHEWEWMEEGDNLRKDHEADIQSFSKRMQESLAGQQSRQQALAMSLSRFSPASAYLHAAMHLAGTHADMKERYESGMTRHSTVLQDYAKEMAKKTGRNSYNGVSIGISSDGTASLSFTGNDDVTIDTSGIPRFVDPVEDLSQVFGQSVLDLVLLLVFTAAALLGAYGVFMRYDVR